MNRDEYLKKLKESVESGKVDEDLTSHHYAILDKAKEKAHSVKIDLDETIPQNNERVQQIREEGKPSEKDKIHFDKYGNVMVHSDEIKKDLLSEDQIRLQNYVSQINEILGEEKVVIKNGEVMTKEESNTVTPEQITKDRVLREIKLLEEENQRCFATISRNNDLLTYLKIELNNL